MGKCLQTAQSNLFCIWGFNTIPLCSPTEALHRKAVNKTPQRHSLCASSPTCSCHSRHTGRRAELLTHLHHDMENDMMCGGGRLSGGMKRQKRNSLGRWEGIYYSSSRFPLHCFWWLLKTKVQIAFRRQTSFIYILHYPYPNSSSKTYHHPIIFLQLSLSLSATLWSLPHPGLQKLPR